MVYISAYFFRVVALTGLLCLRILLAQEVLITHSGNDTSDDPFSLFEGDIAGYRPMRLALFSGVTSTENLWPNRTVPYEISSIYTAPEKETILTAIRDFDEKTCLTFRPKEGHDEYSIYIDSMRTGCFAFWGRQTRFQLRQLNAIAPHLRNRQLVNLEVDECTQHHSIQHELMHTVGFLHEQSRNDRDEYVDILWDNVLHGKAGQFQKGVDSDPQGTPYDFGSVMHYYKDAFSKNKQDTMRPKAQYRSKTLGNKVGLSPIDIEKINRLYKCSQPAPPALKSGQRKVQLYYTVQPEDTVMKIARKLGRDWQQIARDNHISNPDRLSAGSVLLIKGP